jgi:hypothetical protein
MKGRMTSTPSSSGKALLVLQPIDLAEYRGLSSRCAISNRRVLR